MFKHFYYHVIFYSLCLFQVTHNLQVSDGDNGLMLLRDQIVIQIGEEVDGMVMIRSGDNRQGICPLKFLQEVWQLSEVACQVNSNMCTCFANPHKTVMNKIYHTKASSITDYHRQNGNAIIASNNNNKNWKKMPNYKRNVKSGNSLQYYYNNINENNSSSKNNSTYLTKQTNASAEKVKKNQQIFFAKAPFSSTKRPLSIRLSTPKHHVVNFFNRTFGTDSQKRPLLLNTHYAENVNIMNKFRPNFQIIPGKNGLKISSIYTISEDVEKFSLKNSLYRNKNLYISSNSRPLFVRK